MALFDLFKKKENVPSSNLNPDYQKLSALDPYSNQGYYTSPWQGFLGQLGFRTQSDAWKENMSVQSAEYQAALAQKQRDEEYNLPINQVARMRAAGLNPDISGGDGIESGSAQSMPEDPSTPMQSSGQEGELMNFASGVLSCVSTAVGLAGSIAGIQSTRLGNILKSIEGESALAGFAEKMFPYFLPESPEPEISEDGSSRSWHALALERAEAFAGKLPKHMRDKFVSSVQGFWNSAPGTAEAYKDWRSRVSQGKNYEIESRSNFSWDGPEMDIIADELSKLTSKVEKMSLKSEGSESEYNAEYYQSLDPALAAESEKAQQNLDKTNAEMVGALRSSLDSMIQRLKGASEKDNVGGYVSKTLLVLLSMFQLYVASNGMPSVSRSSTSSVNARGQMSNSVQTSLDF